MFKFIGKTLAGVVLTKDAQEAVGKALQAKPAPKPAAKLATPATQARIPAAPQAKAKGAMTAERQALIRNALKVRAAKTQVIGELSDEARANLVGIALIGLLKADQTNPKTRAK